MIFYLLFTGNWEKSRLIKLLFIGCNWIFVLTEITWELVCWFGQLYDDDDDDDDLLIFWKRFEFE
jgi:hypothetical protein